MTASISALAHTSLSTDGKGTSKGDHSHSHTIQAMNLYKQSSTAAESMVSSITQIMEQYATDTDTNTATAGDSDSAADDDNNIHASETSMTMNLLTLKQCIRRLGLLLDGGAGSGSGGNGGSSASAA